MHKDHEASFEELDRRELLKNHYWAFWLVCGSFISYYVYTAAREF